MNLPEMLQVEPIRIPFQDSNHETKLASEPKSCQLLDTFSPPKPFLSPEAKKVNSEKNLYTTNEFRLNSEQQK
jgi:hypothetical protein